MYWTLNISMGILTIKKNIVFFFLRGLFSSPLDVLKMTHMIYIDLWSGVVPSGNRTMEDHHV